MQSIPTEIASAYDLISLLDELSAGCDPDFDSAYEELDRQFAELRLHSGSGNHN